MRELLDIQDLTVHYHTERGAVRAVEGANLKVGKNEVVGLVGESGCGKSTLAFSIIRLISEPGEILGGKILFKNKNLMEMTVDEIRSIRGKEISMVFQDPLTFFDPIMKIERQFNESVMLHLGIDKKEAQERMFELLKEVDIPSPKEVANYYPHQLSGGMRQRIMFCIAMSCNPSLLIADEPTTALDVTTQAQLLALMKKMEQRFKSSTLLITHDLGVVAGVCDRLYIMYAGKIVEHANIFEIFQNPKHPYTSGLLASALSIDEYKKVLVKIKGSVPDLGNLPSGCSFYPRCLQAKPICRKQEPPTIKFSSGREVSCWLYSKV